MCLYFCICVFVINKQLLEIDRGFSFLGRNICRRCHHVLLVTLHIIIVIHIIILIAMVINAKGGQEVAINVLQLATKKLVTI